MTYHPNPKQALFLWKMICAETPDLREPMLSKAKPELNVAKERQPLVTGGFLVVEKRGKASHLVLTDKAWRWAAECRDVELMRSNSRDGAVAMQGLLRRLIPFLLNRDIPLAELMGGNEDASPAPRASKVSVVASGGASQSVAIQIRDTCASLTGKNPQKEIRLSSLRAALPEVPRAVLDAALAQMHEAGHIALYRDDNTAAVTAQDSRDALIVGDAPRHLLYLKG